MKHWLTHCRGGDPGTTGQCSSVPSSVTAVIIESVRSAGRGGDEQQPATSTQHPAIHQRNIKKKTVNSFCSYKFIMTSRLPANKKVLILFLCNYIQHSRAVCLSEMYVHVTSYITSWSILHGSAM